LAASNNLSNHYNPGISLQIIQPLIRGFGRPIVETELNNARDNVFISRLNIENTLRNTITAVIHSYLDVAAAQNALQIDEDALERTQVSIAQTQQFIKAGHKAENELIIAEADLANIKTKIEIDKNMINQMQYALLGAIGIDPNSNITITNIDILKLIKKYHIPSLKQSQKMVLNNDVQYQTDKIILEGSLKRNLLEAIDNQKTQLDLTLNTSTGNGVGGGKYAGLNSIINGINVTNSAMLNLNIPIDDQLAKNAVTNAKIAVQQARLSLQQERWDKETNIINEWNSVFSSERALFLAKNSENLQMQSYDIIYKKYTHGLVDSLELQSAQQQLITVQQSLLLQKITYLKALSNFDLLLGGTLQTWDIHTKYT
jgi:outer membrane protein TolC